MATQVPIRCQCDIHLQVDIDITQKNALRDRLIQVITDLKTEYPGLISDNSWRIVTDFAEEGGSA